MKISKILIIGLVVAAFGFSFFVPQFFTENKIESKSEPLSSNSNQTSVSFLKAAIIDQLHDDIPNVYFQDKAQDYLEQAGFDVDLYTTQDITVDFYKKLPSMDYGFIVMRTHGLEDPKQNNATFLFTGEKYDINRYTQEQLSGHVGKGAPLYVEQLSENNKPSDDQMYFLVGAKLVDEAMVGNFPDSVILIGGCESVRNKDLAKSLIYRGASTVVGWDRTVNSSENDKVMLAFLEKVLTQNEKIGDVVTSLNEEYTPQMEYSSELHHVFRT